MCLISAFSAGRAHVHSFVCAQTKKEGGAAPGGGWRNYMAMLHCMGWITRLFFARARTQEQCPAELWHTKNDKQERCWKFQRESRRWKHRQNAATFCPFILERYKFSLSGIVGSEKRENFITSSKNWIQNDYIIFYGRCLGTCITVLDNCSILLGAERCRGPAAALGIWK
jgi:hypothetical protein